MHVSLMLRIFTITMAKRLIRRAERKGRDSEPAPAEARTARAADTITGMGRYHFTAWSTDTRPRHVAVFGFEA